jgi:hypothetical protein
MSDAPERIWAFLPDIFDNISVWQDEPSPNGDTTEYVRADALVDAQTRIDTLEAERDALREQLAKALASTEKDSHPP